MDIGALMAEYYKHFLKHFLSLYNGDREMAALAAAELVNQQLTLGHEYSTRN